MINYNEIIIKIKDNTGLSYLSSAYIKLVEILVGIINSVNYAIKNLVIQAAFPSYATDPKIIAEWLKKYPLKTGLSSSGTLNITGIAGTALPFVSGKDTLNESEITKWQTADGKIYYFTSFIDDEITEHYFNITSVARNNNVIYVNISNPDNIPLSNNLSITIEGGDFDTISSETINVTSNNTFNFANEGANAVGSGVADVKMTFAAVNIQSKNLGVINNLTINNQLTLLGTFPQIDNIGFVAFGGISGGIDNETIELWRARVESIESNITPNWSFVNLQLEFARQGLLGFYLASKTGADNLYRMYLESNNTQNQDIAREIISNYDLTVINYNARVLFFEIVNVYFKVEILNENTNILFRSNQTSQITNYFNSEYKVATDLLSINSPVYPEYLVAQNDIKLLAQSVFNDIQSTFTNLKLHWVDINGNIIAGGENIASKMIETGQTAKLHSVIYT
jgi:hypothetical protein